MKKKSVISIAGPTAVGKTAVSIHIANHFQTEIISADSRQCYRELNIGVAKPGQTELQSIKHHFIDTHSIQENLNAAIFEAYAIEKAIEIFRAHDQVVLVGGTGLYLKAFHSGFDAMPSVSEEIRESVRAIYISDGLPGLQMELEKTDPLFSETADMQNPRRMMRALEFIRTTGTSIRNYQLAKPKERPFNIISIGLELPREELYARINARVDQMMENGLLTEVEDLLPFKTNNALQTVGYRELFDYLEGKISLENAVDKIKQHTRHYAKRQITWFKADPDIRWFHPDDLAGIFAYLTDIV